MKEEGEDEWKDAKEQNTKKPIKVRAYLLEDLGTRMHQESALRQVC